MLMNKLRGTVADRPIDTRVVRDEPAAPLRAAAQRANYQGFGYLPQMYLPATGDYIMPAPTFMDRVRSILNNLDSSGPDIHIGDVPIYKMGW